MKKFTLFVIILVLSLSLCACKSEAAQGVDDMISAIGEITLDSEEAIVAAETALSALEEKDREQLDFEQTLVDARAKYEDLLLDEEAQEVEVAIATIGKVTLESEASIKSARDAYSKAAPNVRNRVENYSILTEAEKAFHALEIEKAISLIAEIEKIEEITLEDEAIISAARDAFNNVQVQERGKVENRSVLTSAEADLVKLKAEIREKELSEAKAKMRTKYDKFRGITWYHSKTEPYYANSRSFVLPYIAVFDSSSEPPTLLVKYLYTGDNWVFFEKVIILADNERFTETFRYSDVAHDNGGGDVWEQVSAAANLRMLEAIANSTETTVRFEGDDHYYDFTVRSSDKQAIKDVLALYELMK